MIKFLSFVAMIIFIPMRSRQHFVPFGDLDQCLLADLCNHTWIPECGYDSDTKHDRLFLDECDMFEFNCDNDQMFKVTNYSECFGFNSSCPTAPSLLTQVQGFYIYYANGRRVMYSYTTPQSLRKRTTYYTLPTTATLPQSTRTTNWNDRRRYTPRGTGRYKPWFTTKCAQGMCARMKTYVADLRETRTTSQFDFMPPPIELFTKPKKKRNKKRKTKRTTNRTKPTTQILRTATVRPVILKKETVIKNGKKLVKVIKAFKALITKTTEDSDLLE